MSFDFNQDQNFGSIASPDVSGQNWNDVWPSSDTTWDSFDQKQGLDMTGRFQPFDLTNQSGATPDASSYRVPNWGIELSRPDVAAEGATGHQLLPFGDGAFNPRTAYDFWNPAQAIDTLSTWARALIPGVNETGNFMGQVGKNLADSWVGQTISNSPLAGVGSFVGDALGGIVKGGLTLAGDYLSPWDDVTKSYQERDFGGMALNALRLIQGGGLGQKTWERVSGAFQGDQKMQGQLTDELSFLLTVGTLGAGAATGVLARGATALEGQAAKIGLLKAVGTAAEEGATKYTLSPLLQNIATATKFGLAGGYGLEAGSEIGAHLFPGWDNTNKFIASQTSVPMDSPFRGAFELGAASFVDPIPALGKLVEVPGVRKLMDSGMFRLPSPLERIAADMPGAWTGVQNKQQLIKDFYGVGLERVALKDLETKGFREITDSMVQRRADELQQTLLGDGDRKFMGLASDYTNLQASITKEIHSWISEMENHFPEYADRRMTMADLESHWNEVKQFWSAVDKVKPDRDVMLVRSDRLTTKDYQDFIDHLNSKGMSFKSTKKLPDSLKAEIGDKFAPVIKEIHDGGRLGFLNKTQQQIYKDLTNLAKNAPKEPGGGEIGKLADMMRGRGRYKVIYKGSNPVVRDEFKLVEGKNIKVKDAGDVQIGRWHPAAREAEKLLKMHFDDGESVTLNRLKELYKSNNYNDSARLLGKWQYDHTAAYSREGIIRPVLKPNDARSMLMPEGAKKLGTMAANFREYVPNTELGRKFADKFFEVHNKAWGLTREETQNYIKAIKEESDRFLNSTANQWAAGNTPLNAGKPIRELAIEHFGLNRIGDTNPAQLLEKSMPTESWSKFVGVLLGNQPGFVGAGPSFFAGLRSLRSDGIGDFYRWWANVGHPTIRYDLSPLFRFQLPFESRIWNFLAGARNPASDGLLAPAVNDALDDVARAFGGQSMGERRGIGLLPAEATASERVASRTGGATEAISGAATKHNQVEFMYKQVMKQLPERFAERMKMTMPQDYDLLRRTYKSNKDLMDAIVYDQDLKKKFLSGQISKADIESMAKIGNNPQIAPVFHVIEDQLRGAMTDAVRAAQTTHISNPMRRYWERSFSHPVLMYPLSWTIKATGEWAKFLTHSAFGLKSGMAGNVAWGHVQNATMQALVNDPDAMDWVKNHPETVKIMEYILPGLPGSPIPGDNAGVGFGLMSVPLRNAVQTGWNLWNGRPVDENNSDMSKIGVLRDINNVLPKLWSEWALGKPQTTIDNPGLTVGKTKHPQAFDKYINEQLGLDRR